MAKKLNIFNRFNKTDKMENKEVDNSEEIKNEGVDQEQTSEQTDAPKETSQEDEVKVLNDKYLRLYSEFDNYRKRTAKEKIDIITSASEGVIKDLLAIVDDFERAIESNANVEDADALKEGFHLIYNKFYKTLESKGLKKVEAKGESFNADIHEALTNIPAPSEDLKGKVVDVVETGYAIGEKIIRYPKVVVGQ